MATQIQLNNLDAATIPLTGRHLIEASAGTGKTYNITRIYLRLLLERELKVEEILLMTFTKDATQELRGRIDAVIRDALTNWQALCESDSYFKAISERISLDKKESHDKVQFLLKRALLFLDEAAIYTIHGFCQRALTQHAFASGLPFNANMSTNSNDLILEACQDWYRQLAKQNSDAFALIAQFWGSPSSFIRSFAKAISHKSELSVVDVQALVDKFTQLAKKANSAIITDLALLNEGLVSHKKADEQEKRAAELIKLQAWLAQLSECNNEQALLTAIAEPMPDYLLNGSRHPKAFKTALAQVLASSKKIKSEVKDLAKHINKANAYQIVRTAIYQIREQVQQTKEQHNLLDFDDLINTLADCLQNEENNTLAKTLLAQYPVALVDEFQDTDPQQFAILHSIYYQRHVQQAQGQQLQYQQKESALYLIGDPKQAIYGFRGGDIFAYLSARNDCDYHWLMDTNWRSSPDMVNAYNQVFLGDGNNTVFGYGIPYQNVKAGKTDNQSNNSSSNQAGNKYKALQFIHFSNEEGESKQSVRPLMATWCANEIGQLLTDLVAKPQDIAILVRDGREAADIKQALLTANLASVFLSDRANLFHSEQAAQLISVLKGILTPENERYYLSALACGLFGFDAATLYKHQQDEMAYQSLKFSFYDYRAQWQRQGFIAMAINLIHQHFKILLDNKDRTLTNLLHLFEILQSASQKFLQPQELLYWFEQQCSLENNGANSDLEAEQRLENDGDLIRIVTQHGAKGLEYPIVFIPFSTRHKDPLKFGNQSVSYIEYHNEQGKLCLSLDGDEQAKAAMANEAYAETIRLLYVAITRAEKCCYILTTPFDKYSQSPLGKALQWHPEQEIVANLQHLMAKAPQAIDVKKVSFDAIEAEIYQQSHSDLTDTTMLEVSHFYGKIERDWWLSSFSALSRNLRHGGISTPDRDTELLDNADRTSKKTKSLRFELAKGAHSGNLLHDILESSDFVTNHESPSHWQESIKWPLVKYGELTAGFTEDDLITWLDEIVATPLNSTLLLAEQAGDLGLVSDEGFCLADISMQQTLRESEFYFPMKEANISALAKLLTDHRNSALVEQNYAHKTNHVRLPSYQSLKGMMHGFIDLVFEQGGKYYVCDYKSSHLGDNFTDYNAQALRNNIEQNYYDLQYLIYCLALHRYLQQNITDYNAEQHFGGIYYLYLRGMTNDKKYTGAGVYFRKILVDELTALDCLFLGEEALGKKVLDKEFTDKNIAAANEET
ncbi:MAG: exodeoxyribonuclease V subunit beta [Colwellia sp.]|nr:exodeoxyribonuclease V subunit beta [Colwellia sp.]